MRNQSADQLAEDRAILVDCIHHADAQCDAAAARLSRSADPHDQTLAREWQRMRAAETAA